MEYNHNENDFISALNLNDSKKEIVDAVEAGVKLHIQKKVAMSKAILKMAVEIGIENPTKDELKMLSVGIMFAKAISMLHEKALFETIGSIMPGGILGGLDPLSILNSLKKSGTMDPMTVLKNIKKDKKGKDVSDEANELEKAIKAKLPFTTDDLMRSVKNELNTDKKDTDSNDL